ncbi:hypothetical protein LCGC14_1099480 [marine sediment metagenome]|uniref:Uncharacterized protein n=1 Tax=marine sediment metagenome TaxID=412755 RepID=A0A0F9QG24_9ZZZZ|nr:hypothetical protein [Phycisphaerae bacterium]HDZ42610.1 hypothetical protein [Phycisphaerae bacterium]
MSTQQPTDPSQSRPPQQPPQPLRPELRPFGQADAPPVAAAADRPLSPEHLLQVEQADVRARTLRKAGGVAMFNGVTFAIFAAGSGLFALVNLMFGEFDAASVVMTVGLAVVASNEFKGRRLIRSFDRRAPKLLGWNQIGLMALLVAYGAWMIANAYLGPDPYAEQIAENPSVADQYAWMSQIDMAVKLAVYGGLIAGTLIFQGLNARYYFSRAKLLTAYLDETPDWVVDLQRRSPGA